MWETSFSDEEPPLAHSSAVITDSDTSFTFETSTITPRTSPSLKPPSPILTPTLRLSTHQLPQTDFPVQQSKPLATSERSLNTPVTPVTSLPPSFPQQVIPSAQYGGSISQVSDVSFHERTVSQLQHFLRRVVSVRVGWELSYAPSPRLNWYMPGQVTPIFHLSNGDVILTVS